MNEHDSLRYINVCLHMLYKDILNGIKTNALGRVNRGGNFQIEIIALLLRIVLLQGVGDHQFPKFSDFFCLKLILCDLQPRVVLVLTFIHKKT